MSTEANKKEPITVDMENSPLNLWGIAYGTIKDERVLDAIRKVDRAKFLPFDKRLNAYRNITIELGNGVSCSEPLLVYMMIEALELKEEDHVLEIGGGTCYAAALASRCCAKVEAIDYQESVCSQARVNLLEAGISNVEVFCGDGAEGLPEHAPYDAIMVSGHFRQLPTTLLYQLKEGGKIIIPLGKDPYASSLIVGKRNGPIISPRIFLEPVFFHKIFSEKMGGWNEDLLDRSRKLKRTYQEDYFHSLTKEGKTELIVQAKDEAYRQNIPWPETEEGIENLIIDGMKGFLLDDLYFKDLDAQNY